MIIGKIKWNPVDSAGIAVSLALTAAVAYLGFLPIYHRHITYLDQQRELQTKKQDNAQQEMSLKATEKLLAVTQTQLAKIPLRLQPATQLNEKLAAVTALAAGSNLKIEDISPGATAKGKRYDAVNIHVAGEGSYPASAAFLHQLKITMPDIGIQSLRVVSEGTANAQARFFFDLQWFAASSADVASAQ